MPASVSVSPRSRAPDGGTVTPSRTTAPPSGGAAAVRTRASPRQLHHLQPDPVPSRRISCALAGAALIDIRQLHRLAGRRLHGLDQRPDLRLDLLIRSRDVQRKQVPRGIHRDLDPGALTPLVLVVAGAATDLERGLYRAAVQDYGRRFRPSGEASTARKVVDDRLEGAGSEPPAGLLVPSARAVSARTGNARGRLLRTIQHKVSRMFRGAGRRPREAVRGRVRRTPILCRRSHWVRNRR